MPVAVAPGTENVPMEDTLLIHEKNVILAIVRETEISEKKCGHFSVCITRECSSFFDWTQCEENADKYQKRKTRSTEIKKNAPRRYYLFNIFVPVSIRV